MYYIYLKHKYQGSGFCSIEKYDPTKHGKLKISPVFNQILLVSAKMEDCPAKFQTKEEALEYFNKHRTFFAPKHLVEVILIHYETERLI